MKGKDTTPCVDRIIMKKIIFILAIVGFVVFTVSVTALAVPSVATTCDVSSCGDTYFEAEPFEGELCEEAEASNLASFIPEKAEEATLCSESIYDVLANGMRQMESKIDISNFEISKNNIATLNEYHVNTLYMNPELYYVSSYYTYWYDGKGFITAVSPKYLVTDKDEIENTQSQIETAVNELVAYTHSSMTDIEKLLTVFDRIVLSGSYDDSLQLRTAKNLLLDGKSVCAGYASAFYAVATKLDIPCGFVRSEDMNHVWNAVCVEDTWYHVDITWDDSSYVDSLRVTHEYFLKSNAWMENEGDHYGFTFIADNCEKYDDYFWNDAVSQIVIHNNNMYYVDGADSYGSIYCYDTVTGIVEEIYRYNSLWPTEASSRHWLGAYSGIALYNNRLYFNTWNEILSCELDGKNIEVVFTHPDAVDTSIYGSRIESDKLYYVVGEKSNPYIITEKHSITLYDVDNTNSLSAIETQHDKSMRVTGKSGIRFKATLEKSAAASAFGWIVTREAILKGNNIDPATLLLNLLC